MKLYRSYDQRKLGRENENANQVYSQKLNPSRGKKRKLVDLSIEELRQITLDSKNLLHSHFELAVKHRVTTALVRRILSSTGKQPDFINELEKVRKRRDDKINAVTSIAKEFVNENRLIWRSS